MIGGVKMKNRFIISQGHEPDERRFLPKAHDVVRMQIKEEKSGFKVYKSEIGQSGLKDARTSFKATVQGNRFFKV